MDTCHAVERQVANLNYWRKFSQVVFLCALMYIAQWGLPLVKMCASTVGSILGWGIKIPHVTSVQLLSCVLLFVTPWTAARQTSLSITNSRSLLKLMSIESVMPSNRLILCHPLFSHLQSFPASGAFLISQFFTSSGQSIGVSASASVLPMNIHVTWHSQKEKMKKRNIA